LKRKASPPPELVEIEKWMGALILSPFQNNLSEPFTETECQNFVRSTPSLKAHERVFIYHQQYWLRLFKTLQENFPCLTRLFGYHSFNQLIALPYLLQNPPAHWALCRLGESLPEWVEKNYHQPDHDFIYDMTRIECSFQRAFWVRSHPSLTVDFFIEAKKTPLYLQPHVQLFQLKANLFQLRDAFLNQPVEHWQESPFPPLEPKDSYFMLCRDPTNYKALWKELKPNEYFTLKAFEKGSLLKKALSSIKVEGEEVFSWFKLWSSLKILTVTKT
jgi:hypothetical protein